MKKSVTEILDHCQPQELDGMLENIDEKLPDEAAEDRIKKLVVQKASPYKRPHTVRRLVLIAACIALVACVLVGCYVAEKVEYDNAVKFFDLNDLDTDGMSRGDIKRVYRDINTERFAYDDSCQMLCGESVSENVGGVDISITNNMSNTLNNGEIGSLNLGIAPFVGYGDIPDGTQYFIGDEFEKNAGGETVWRTKLPHYYYDRYYLADGKALIWGEFIYDDVHDYMHTSVALIDDADGRIIWEKTLDSKYRFDEYAEAAMTGDGRIAVLTVATDDRFSDSKVRVFRELDISGEVVAEHEQQDDGIVFIHRVIPLSDGWLAEISYDEEADLVSDSGKEISIVTNRFVKLGFDGRTASEWKLGDYSYDEIADIKEYGGKIYLSVQTRAEDSPLSGVVDYNNIPKDMDSLSDSFTDELRDAARKKFSSVLYVFDPKTEKPEQFYSIGGTMAGKLCTNDDGELLWQVGRIVKCGWAPWANSFQYYGITRRYDYTFTEDKTVLKEERTDQFNSFRTM